MTFIYPTTRVKIILKLKHGSIWTVWHGTYGVEFIRLFKVVREIREILMIDSLMVPRHGRVWARCQATSLGVYFVRVRFIFNFECTALYTIQYSAYNFCAQCTSTLHSGLIAAHLLFYLQSALLLMFYTQTLSHIFRVVTLILLNNKQSKAK